MKTTDTTADSVNPKYAAEHQRLRHEVMNCMKANKVPVTGDVFFSLAFMTIRNLRKMARKLHIPA